MRTLSLAALLALAACGGGGGGRAAVVFDLSGTVPAPGATNVPVTAPIVITFTLDSDPASITHDNIELLGRDGNPVGFDFVVQVFNATSVRIIPLAPLDPNEQYRLVIRGDVRSAGGDPLGADREVCFLTESPVPTVRPDQIVDLGDRLIMPRFLARSIRLMDGRIAVVGGFVDPAAATDTIEVWNPATRAFDLLATRLDTPRAEHTLTLLSGGRVLIAGGVSAPGGPPLRSTEIWDPGSNGLSQGPALNEARRWHAASPLFDGAGAMVSGGIGTDGEARDDAEVFDGNRWVFATGRLAEGVAQHVQVTYSFDQVYIGVGNLHGAAGRYDGAQILQRTEGDARFRACAARVDTDRVLVAGGDTRSLVIYDFSGNTTWGGTEFLHDRRGAFSLTARDGTGRRFLAAGGFQISAPGSPALRTLEIVDYLPVGRFGFPDVAVWPVENVFLPVAFAGHVGFRDPGGATVLAGGFGDGVGPHSRRVVMILDAQSTPPPACR